MYLSESDFQKAFGMSKAAWATTAAWKKPELKKKAGLF